MKLKKKIIIRIYSKQYPHRQTHPLMFLLSANLKRNSWMFQAGLFWPLVYLLESNIAYRKAIQAIYLTLCFPGQQCNRSQWISQYIQREWVEPRYWPIGSRLMIHVSTATASLRRLVAWRNSWGVWLNIFVQCVVMLCGSDCETGKTWKTLSTCWTTFVSMSMLKSRCL